MHNRLLSVLAVCILLYGCDLIEEHKERRVLASLVERGATLDEVARELGAGYTVYEKGKPSWQPLQEFLDRERPGALPKLRENAAKYPTVMSYTSMWRMAWIFLDEKGVIRDYYVTAQ